MSEGGHDSVPLFELNDPGVVICCGRFKSKDSSAKKSGGGSRMLVEQDVMASDRLRSYIKSDRDRLVSCVNVPVTSSSEATSGASSDMLIAKLSSRGHLRFGAGRRPYRINRWADGPAVEGNSWASERSERETAMNC